MFDNTVNIQTSFIKDQVRFRAYKNAIEQVVGPEDDVVDLGSGLGLLSSLAARYGKNVTAIEACTKLAELSKVILPENVTLINEFSHAVSLQNKPTTLVTETIGSLGPEEYIVESVYHFLSEHRTIKKIIPATLSIWALPINSNKIRTQKSTLENSLEVASRVQPELNGIRTRLLDEVFQEIFYTVLDDAVYVEEPKRVVTYELGKTSTSEFETSLDLPKCDAVHFYFVAELSQSSKLSTSALGPLTHWEHAYLISPDPKKMHRLSIRFNVGNPQLTCNWTEEVQS